MAWDLWINGVTILGYGKPLNLVIRVGLEMAEIPWKGRSNQGFKTRTRAIWFRRCTWCAFVWLSAFWLAGHGERALIIVVGIEEDGARHQYLPLERAGELLHYGRIEKLLPSSRLLPWLTDAGVHRYAEHLLVHHRLPGYRPGPPICWGGL